MNIVITGIAGFIGSHLGQAFLAQNHNVIGIDNFDTFYARKVKENNISNLLKHDRFTFIETDLRQLTADTVILSNIDMVIHLAAKAGVLNSVEDISSYLETNILATKNILEWMRKARCQKIIFASSSSIYGNANRPPFVEDGITDKPLTPYASSKKACELLTYNYHHIFGFDVLNLRLFTVYGPRQRPDLVMHKFAKQIEDNKAITIFGDGSSMRDYTYIDDIVAGFLKAANYLEQHNSVYENINLGNQHPIKLIEIVNMLYRFFEKKPQIIYENIQLGDMLLTCADISKAQRLLGYTPQMELSNGLKLFVEWFRKADNN